MTGVTGCCACAASGHAATALPRRVMNSRRRICPRVTQGTKGSTLRAQCPLWVNSRHLDLLSYYGPPLGRLPLEKPKEKGASRKH